jgi:DNA-binding NarL/FixJ family response regulator
MTEILGRDGELAAVERFFERPPPSALLIDGEAGIGKTTVWRGALRRAEAKGMRVLSASAGEAEEQLPYTVLGDLLEPVDAELDTLPRPQRSALAVALLREEPAATAPDPRAVGVALLALLRTLTAAAPLVLAMDDVQWIDADSLAAFAFAFRRLRDLPAGLVLARRTTVDETEPPVLLERAPFDHERMPLRGLSVGATAALVRERLGLSLRRPTLLRVHETSGGNPLFALRLAAAVDHSAGDELRLPSSLRQLVEDDIARLPEATRDALLLVAETTEPTTALLGGAEPALLPAADARVIEIRDGRISFTHPLLRSAVHSLADPAELRALHARLAQHDLPIEQRARHLALSTVGVDPATADVLEEGARAASLRGAPAVAARLAAEAVDRTDPEDADALRRRRYILADECAAAGDFDRAVRELETIVATAPSGPIRAEGLLRLAKNPRDLAASKALCVEALDDAGDDLTLRCDILVFLSKLTLVLREQDESERLVGEAVAVARAIEDEPREIHARVWKAFVDTAAGRSIDREALENADVADAALYDRRAPIEDSAAYIRAIVLLNAGDFDEALAAWQGLDRLAVETGNETPRAEVLGNLAKLAYLRGDWEDGRRHDDDAVELVEELGLDHMIAGALAQRAMHAAMRGDLDVTLADAARAVEIATRTHEPFTIAQARYALALAALSRGNFAQAATEADLGLQLLGSADHAVGMGARLLPVAVEASLATGARVEAERAAGRLDELAEEVGTTRLRAEAAQCRGLTLAADGDLARAAARLHEAARLAAEARIPLDEGRTLLLLGEVQRRARRRREARETLQQALAIFERLGAAEWAKRARAEIARIGGRAPAAGGLTPTEARVAALVAAGKTNKEVAAELVVSVRAVEANLSRIYGKLGIRSRTELASRYHAPDGADVR